MFRKLVFAVLLALPAGAGELSALIREALERNPEILAARAKVQAMRQKPAQEASWADPMLSLGYQSAGGPLPGQGLGMEPTANIGFMVSQPIPAAGKLRLRSRIAWKDADAMTQEYWQAQLSVVSRLRTAWHRLHHSYEMLRLVEENRALTERILRATEARYASGKAMQAELIKTQTQLTLLEAKKTKLEQEKRARVAEINLLRARALDAPVAAPPNQEAVPLRATLEELEAQAKQWSPMVRKEQAGIEKSELQVALARKDGALDYTVSAGYYTMGSMPSMYMAKVDFNVPWFTRARQRSMVTEQANSLEAARRAYQAAGNTLMYRLKEDYLMQEAAWRLLRIYSTTLLPQAQLALDSALNSYETGQGDFVSVLMSAAMRLEAEESYHEALMDHHLALVRLEEMTGLVLMDEEAKP